MPVYEYAQSETDPTNYVLQSQNTSTNPNVFEADQGVTATLTGSITSGSASTQGPYGTIAANQSVVIQGPGTIALANSTATPNSWTGGTTIDGGGTLSIDSVSEIGTGGLSLGDATTSGALSFTNSNNTQSLSQAMIVGAGGGTVSVTNADGIVKINGNISGGRTLTKTGAGTLVLLSDNYTDSTIPNLTVSSGVVQLGKQTQQNQLYVNISNNITDNGKVVSVYGLIDGDISGTGVLEITNVCQLVGNDALEGGTIVDHNAQLYVRDSGALSAAVVDNGVVSVQAYNQSIYVSGDITGAGSVYLYGSGDESPITVTANILTTGNSSTSGVVYIGDGGTTGSISGTVEVDGYLYFDRSDRSIFSGAIGERAAGGEPGYVYVEGGGTLVLTGSDGASGGTTVVQGSTLDLGSGGIVTSDVTDEGAITADSGGIAQIASSISGAGSLTQSGLGTLLLSGDDSVATRITGGTLKIIAGGSIAEDVVDDASLIFASPGVSTYEDDVTGDGKVTVTGNGTHVLTGSDAVTGGTTIAANSSIEVGDEADAGSISGSVTNGGALALLNGSLSGANVTNKSSASVDLSEKASAAGATITNQGGQISFSDMSSGGSAHLINKAGNISFYDDSTADAATINNQLGLIAFFDDSSGGSATISSSGTIAFFDHSDGGNASFTIASDGIMDFSGTKGAAGDGTVSADMIRGYGAVKLGSNKLSIGAASGLDYFGGVLSDGGNSGGRGASIVKTGQNTLTLAHANKYTGGTTIEGGILHLGALNAAGTGTIAFDGSAKLVLQGAALSGSGGTLHLGNTISGFAGDDKLDLRSLALVKGSTTATLSGSTLTVSNGSTNVTLTLSGEPDGTVFKTKSDGNGGTLVFVGVSQNVAAASAPKVDSS